MNVFQHLRKVFVRRLLADDFDRTQQRHAATQERRQLSIGGRHNTRSHARRAFASNRTSIRGGHLERKQVAAGKRRHGLSLSACRERTFHAVAQEIALM